ncbi:hypothetical protein [Metabacillus sp. SLBN-84]
MPYGKTGKTWTTEQDKALMTYFDGYTGNSFYDDAARTFERTTAAVKQRFRKLSKERNMGKDNGRRSELTDADLEHLDRIENAVGDAIQAITGKEPDFERIHDVIETLSQHLRTLGYDTNVPYREE